MFDASTTLILDDHPGLRVGDHVTIRREVLVEVGRTMPGLPPTWCCIPAGMHGKLIGWRDSADEVTRAVVDLDGTDRRVVVFVGEHHVARIRLRWAPREPERPQRPFRRHRR